jgi:hypothetical protein
MYHKVDMDLVKENLDESTLEIYRYVVVILLNMPPKYIDNYRP